MGDGAPLPKDRPFYAWHPRHQEWIKVEIFPNNRFPDLVRHVRSGEAWHAAIWRDIEEPT